MSACSRCGARFDCAMADGSAAPCWCTAMPAVMPLPAGSEAGEASAPACWCPACLQQQIAALAQQRAAAQGDEAGEGSDPAPPQRQ